MTVRRGWAAAQRGPSAALRASGTGASVRRSGLLAAGFTYFSLVFAVGFVLGTLRVLIAVPAVGERAAELLETPLMILASFFAARWVVRRFRVPPGARSRLPVGLVALALLLIAEVLVVLLVQGLSLHEYAASRDPVAGAVYLAALAIFALIPWLLRDAG